MTALSNLAIRSRATKALAAQSTGLRAEATCLSVFLKTPSDGEHDAQS